MLESDEKRSRYIIGNSNVWSSQHQYIRQEPSLIFWVCLYSLFYRVVFLLVRPKKWLSGRLHSKSLKKSVRISFVHALQVCQCVSLSKCMRCKRQTYHSRKGHLELGNPWFSHKSKRLSMLFWVELPKFCHQLLLLSKSNRILPSSNMGARWRLQLETTT